MKRFTKFLDEAFDKPYKFEWKVKQDRWWTGTTRISGGRVLSINLRAMGKSDKGIMWELIFTVNEDIRTTGGGDQFRIFATVLDALKEFIEEVEPYQIRFSSNKTNADSRSKLYTRIIQKFGTVMGYRAKIDTSDSWEDEFTLTRV